MLKQAMCVLAHKHGAKQMGFLKAHKTTENNTSKTKQPAAFQRSRNGTFSLQAWKLYTWARSKLSDLKKVQFLFGCANEKKNKKINKTTQ